MNRISPMIDEIGARTGGSTSGGRAAADELELLGHHLARRVDVGAPLELDPHHRYTRRRSPSARAARRRRR
jgi:hypothetical protein